MASWKTQFKIESDHSLTDNFDVDWQKRRTTREENTGICYNWKWRPWDESHFYTNEFVFNTKHLQRNVLKAYGFIAKITVFICILHHINDWNQKLAFKCHLLSEVQKTQLR